MLYASRTGTQQNLDRLRRHGWGLLVSRASAWRTEGFPHWIADNGAWSDYQRGQPFDEAAFDEFLAWIEAQATVPDWICLPDVVAGGAASLALSTRWLNRCLSVAPLVLVAVQDGMEADDLDPIVGPNVGVFLGGSTPWKLANMATWGAFCAQRGLHYHVARVNSIKRMSLAIAAGADSVDGSSASRYACTIPMLTYAARQTDLFAVR